MFSLLLSVKVLAQSTSLLVPKYRHNKHFIQNLPIVLSHHPPALARPLVLGQRVDGLHQHSNHRLRVSHGELSSTVLRNDPAALLRVPDQHRARAVGERERRRTVLPALDRLWEEVLAAGVVFVVRGVRPRWARWIVGRG